MASVVVEIIIAKHVLDGRICSGVFWAVQHHHAMAEIMYRYGSDDELYVRAYDGCTVVSSKDVMHSCMSYIGKIGKRESVPGYQVRSTGTLVPLIPVPGAAGFC